MTRIEHNNRILPLKAYNGKKFSMKSVKHTTAYSYITQLIFERKHNKNKI